MYLRSALGLPHPTTPVANTQENRGRLAVKTIHLKRAEFGSSKHIPSSSPVSRGTHRSSSLVNTSPAIAIVTHCYLSLTTPIVGDELHLNCLLRELLANIAENIINNAAESLYLVPGAAHHAGVFPIEFSRNHLDCHTVIMPLDIRHSDGRLQEEGFQQRVLR